MAKHPSVTNVDFKDMQFYNELKNTTHPNSENIKTCLLHLALCHTIITEEKNKKLVYNVLYFI